MVSRCCVRGCKNSYPKVKLHRFPSNPEKLKTWLEAVHRLDLLQKPMANIQSVYRVCQEHFDPIYIIPPNKNRTNLLDGAVPTLKIGAPDNQQNVDQIPSTSSVHAVQNNILVSMEHLPSEYMTAPQLI